MNLFASSPPRPRLAREAVSHPTGEIASAYGLAMTYSFLHILASSPPHTPLKAEKPPSTGTTTPVTNAEAGESSHIIVPSKSSAVPKRPIGV